MLTSGKVYRYAQVPLQAFNNFRDAESAGKHYTPTSSRSSGRWLDSHFAKPELRRAQRPGDRGSEMLVGLGR
jgi:hypothetical protein